MKETAVIYKMHLLLLSSNVAEFKAKYWSFKKNLSTALFYNKSINVIFHLLEKAIQSLSPAMSALLISKPKHDARL